VPDFDLEALRSDFPILERRTYLNSCSLGALSRRAESYLDDFREGWHTMGASAWYEHWLGRVEELRRSASRFVGADPDDVALLPTTSVALGTVIDTAARHAVGGGERGARRDARTRIVTTDLDFPTLVYQGVVRSELETVVLESEDGIGVPVERFAEAVDERTLLVATSHVYFSTGYVQDVAKLVRVAHAAGSYALIDGYQGPGQIPIDLPATGVDFFTWGPLKWLCGGPGLSYLYVRPDHVERMEPRLTSWFATQNPFDFDPHGFAYRPNARRFEVGTPALPTIHTALGGQELMAEVGIERIRTRNAALVDRLVAGCQDAGFSPRLPTDRARRSAIVPVAHDDPDGAVRALAEAGIVVDHRPGHLRVSPHVYNSEEEVDRFVRALAMLRG